MSLSRSRARSTGVRQSTATLLARRWCQQYRIGEQDSDGAFVAAAEDTILQKLLWYRRGHGVSDRQWQDLLGVLRVQRDRLDRAYLDRWATELDLRQLLDEAVAEARQQPG